MGQSVMLDKSPSSAFAMTDAPAAPPPLAPGEPNVPQPALLFHQHQHLPIMHQQHLPASAPASHYEHQHLAPAMFPPPPPPAVVFPGTGVLSQPPATIYGYPVLPMQPVSIMDHTGIFLAGFRDCAAEAIKYLTELESMSDDDPAIQGLRLHLDDRQDTLKSNSTSSGSPRGGSDSPTGSSSHSTPMKSKLNDSVLDEGYGSILMSDHSSSTPTTPKSSAFSSFSSSPYSPYPYPPHYIHHHNHTQTVAYGSGGGGGILSHPVLPPMFTMPAMTPASPIAGTLQPPTWVTSTPVMSAAPQRSHSQQPLIPSPAAPHQTLHTPHCSPEKELPDLAELAQNNPAIASVAQELMELLEEEFLEDEDEEDEAGVFCEEEEMDSEGEVIVHDEEDKAERSS